MRELGNKKCVTKMALIVNLHSLFLLYRRVTSIHTARGSQESKLCPVPWQSEVFLALVLSDKFSVMTLDSMCNPSAVTTHLKMLPRL